MSDTATILINAGWKTTRSGRWHHPIAFPGIGGRKGRMFLTHDALALVAVDPTTGEATTHPERHESSVPAS